jgi:hypothetical protein
VFLWNFPEQSQLNIEHGNNRFIGRSLKSQIIDTKVMIEKEQLLGDNPLLITLDKIQSTDIDDEDDFFIAETLFNKLGIDWVMS